MRIRSLRGALQIAGKVCQVDAVGVMPADDRRALFLRPKRWP